MTVDPRLTPADGAALPFASDALTPGTFGGIRIKHPLECRPRRPKATPRYQPRRDRRDAGSRQPRAARFLSPALNAAADLGPVRINFRYAGFQSVTAGYSEKARRQQWFEGPHESYGFRLQEIDPDTIDLQYQPIALSYDAGGSRMRSIILDYGIETVDGRVVFGEDKATQAFFDEREMAERLDFAEAYLAPLGAFLERRVAGGIRSDLHRLVVKEIFDNRRTEFDERDVDVVRSVVAAEGGTAPLGKVIDALRHPPRTALRMVHAMMRHRLASVPHDRPAMRDTPVRIPVPATPGALRAFLARHVAAATEAGE